MTPGRPRLLPPKKKTGKQPHVSQPVYLTIEQMSRLGVCSGWSENHVTEAEITAMIRRHNLGMHHLRPDGLPVYDARAIHFLFNPGKGSKMDTSDERS